MLGLAIALCVLNIIALILTIVQIILYFIEKYEGKNEH